MSEPWFRARTYGWGWTPASIEGWLVLLGFVAVASISNGYRYTVQKGCDTLEQAIWDEQVKVGLIAGAGIEYAFTEHFVGRGEYLYADYGSVTLSSRDRARAEFRNEMHLVRVGASYRF